MILYIEILLFAGTSFILLEIYDFLISIKEDKSLNKGLSAEDMNKSSLSFQRLETEIFYPYLVGLCEGDGWFSISKKGKYLLYDFGFELSVKDTDLLKNILCKIRLRYN